MKKTSLLCIAFILVLTVCAVANAAASTLMFPDDLKVIEEKAFFGDTSLDTAVLPDGVQTIGRQAFAYSSLKQIHLPSSLTFVADDAFEGCSQLHVTAEAGSYAHEWAVGHAYIDCAPEWGPHRIDYWNERLVLFLSWPYMNAERYDVYRSEQGSSNIQLIGSVTPEGTGSQGYSDETIELGKSYNYWLRLVTENDGKVYEEGYNSALAIDIKDIYVGTIDESYGYADKVSVYSKYPWEVESLPSWLNASQQSGEPGKTTVHLQMKLNNTGTDRDGFIYFSSGTSLAAKLIRQMGMPFGLVGLEAIADSSSACVDLSWFAGENATGYLVYRSHNAETGFVQVADTTDASYSDTSVEYGSTYYYKVLEYADEFDGTRTVGYDSGSSVCVSTVSQIAVPESISISCSTSLVDMWVGDYNYLKATIEPSVVDNDTVYWSSSDESVAYVNEKGSISAIGIGSATITATTVNGLTATYDVSVIRGYPAPEVVVESIGCETARIYWNALDGAVSYNVYDKYEKFLGSTTGTQYIATDGSPDSRAKYYVEAVYDDGTVSRKKSDTDVFWSSPDTPQLVVVEKTSTYVQLSWTEAATADHYYLQRSSTSDMSEFDVWQKVLTTTYTDTEVVPGETYYYQVGSCSWEGIGKAGSEVISVTIPVDEETYIEPYGIELDITELNVTNDIDTLQLVASVLPNNATNKKVTWESSDERVATVDGNGVVTILSGNEGCITIKAITCNGYSATCTIGITAIEDEMSSSVSGNLNTNFSGGFDENIYTLSVGEQLPMTGSVSLSTGISRITVKVDGYHPDGENGDNRYASRSFVGESVVNLNEYDDFVIDADALPFNRSGLYTMRLWASDKNGNYACIDTAYVRVLEDLTITPTIFVTIGDSKKQYVDGDHIGCVYNTQDNMMWINAHFTNTQRAWFRIEYPEDTGRTDYVSSESFDVKNNEQSWYRAIPANAEPGVYEIKIDAVNSSVTNDYSAPRTTISLTVEVKENEELPPSVNPSPDTPTYAVPVVPSMNAPKSDASKALENLISFGSNAGRVNSEEYRLIDEILHNKTMADVFAKVCIDKYTGNTGWIDALIEETMKLLTDPVGTITSVSEDYGKELLEETMMDIMKGGNYPDLNAAAEMDLLIAAKDITDVVDKLDQQIFFADVHLSDWKTVLNDFLAEYGDLVDEDFEKALGMRSYSDLETVDDGIQGLLQKWKIDGKCVVDDGFAPRFYMETNGELCRESKAYTELMSMRNTAGAVKKNLETFGKVAETIGYIADAVTLCSSVDQAITDLELIRSNYSRNYQFLYALSTYGSGDVRSVSNELLTGLKEEFDIAKYNTALEEISNFAMSKVTEELVDNLADAVDKLLGGSIFGSILMGGQIAGKIPFVQRATELVDCQHAILGWQIQKNALGGAVERAIQNDSPYTLYLVDMYIEWQIKGLEISQRYYQIIKNNSSDQKEIDGAYQLISAVMEDLVEWKEYSYTLWQLYWGQ